jgi:cytochrome P450
MNPEGFGLSCTTMSTTHAPAEIQSHAAPDVGDVDIHAEAFVADPFAGFERLRAQCPVAHSKTHGGFYVLSRHDDVRAAAINWRDFTSSVAGVTAIPVITPRTEPMLPIEVDPPQHARYRALINPVFAQSRVDEIAPRVRQIIDDGLDRLVAHGEGDAVADLCVPVAVNALAAFTDFPLEDAADWVSWITRMFNHHDRADGAKAATAMGGYIRSLIAARRKHPNGDFISLLMEAEIDGEQLSDAQIHSFITVVFGAGFETTADALSVMLHWLALNPGGLEAIKARPDLLATAVEEFLRHSSPVQVFGRNATRDITLHGRVIEKGAIVGLAFAGANYDPAVFDCPAEIRLDRSPNRHLAFGAGPHLCAGAPVARMEMRLVLESLIAKNVRLAPAASKPPRWKTRGDRRGLALLPLIVTAQGARPSASDNMRAPAP